MERDGVRFLSLLVHENEENSMTRYLANQRLIVRVPWREMSVRRKISVQICLRTYSQRQGERKGTRWVFHITDRALRTTEESHYQINIESFCTALRRRRQRDNQRTGSSTWQELLKWRWNAGDKKKVQLQHVDCKGFCCYSAKWKVYGGVSMESPKQVGMFRVNPPH